VLELGTPPEMVTLFPKDCEVDFPQIRVSVQLVDFLYQTTDLATNVVIGTPNSPANIPAGGMRTFVIALTPFAAFEATEVVFRFAGLNTEEVGTILGVNTLLLSASPTPVPDIVALAATLDNNGIVTIPGATGTGVFAVATVNVGIGGGGIRLVAPMIGGTDALCSRWRGRFHHHWGPGVIRLRVLRRTLRVRCRKGDALPLLHATLSASPGYS
jgi:hypothetical protein